MPEMDGFEATAEIRKREGETRHTTIVAMTANALEGERQRCVAAGMDDYISKPVKTEVLHGIIERWTSLTKGAESSAAQAEERASIDMNALSSLRDLQSRSEPNLLAELIDSFLRDTSDRLAAMRSASANGDAQTLTRTVHALKGGCGIVGATRMTALCEIIEELGRTGSVEGTPVLITALDEEFGRVRRALQAEKSAGPEARASRPPG
jgi:CheY-like chemotaxis protein